MPRPGKAPVLYEDLTYKIIGAAMEVHKHLGPIHKESIYQKALIEAFRADNIPFEREVRLPVRYQGKQVGIYIPDYLQSTSYKIGLLINFGSQKLQVRRRIYG